MADDCIQDGSSCCWLTVHVKSLSREAKHALFGNSRIFRRLDVHLDDDVTKQQRAGRRSFSGKSLQLKQLNCKTWWPLDTLCWPDTDGAHKESPSL